MKRFLTWFRSLFKKKPVPERVENAAPLRIIPDQEQPFAPVVLQPPAPQPETRRDPDDGVDLADVVLGAELLSEALSEIGSSSDSSSSDTPDTSFSGDGGSSGGGGATDDW